MSDLQEKKPSEEEIDSSEKKEKVENVEENNDTIIENQTPNNSVSLEDFESFKKEIFDIISSLTNTKKEEKIGEEDEKLNF